MEEVEPAAQTLELHAQVRVEDLQQAARVSRATGGRARPPQAQRARFDAVAEPGTTGAGASAAIAAGEQRAQIGVGAGDGDVDPEPREAEDDRAGRASTGGAGGR
jgi:hypothetical protein